MSEKESERPSRKEINYLEGKNLIIAVLAALCLGMVGYFIWAGDMFHSISKDKAVEQALAHINEKMLAGTNVTAVIVGQAEEDKALYRFYRFKVKIGEKEIPSYVYVTQNGKLLFPESQEIVAKDTQASKPVSCETVTKADKPLIEAFIVSQCPYGLQMQRILAEIVKSNGAFSDNINISYIGAVTGGKITAMHGDKEAQENLKQICIREEQKDKFYSYLACYMKKGETDKCLTEASVNKALLNTCTTDPNKGLKYAAADFAKADSYGVQGSPTLFLNGQKADEFTFGGRTAQAVKEMVCCAFNQKPDFCDTELTKDDAAVGYSEQYSSGSGASTDAANCAPATQ